jgi:ADP-ribosyl-[dinitrogen reductase] hydrolase
MNRTAPAATPSPAALLPQATALVLAAGARLRAAFHRPGGPQGRGATAVVDREVEQFLKEYLMALHPAGWRGEETPHVPAAGGDQWVVDPQDGTRAFLRGLRGAAVSVALLRDGAPVLAIVHAPCAPDDGGDLFTWAMGAEGEGVALRRNGIPLPRRAAVPYHAGTVIAMNEEAGDYALANHARFAPARVLAMPSIAYRLALVAAGEADLALSLTTGLDAYDIAGGHGLLIGAGLALTDLRGRPVRYEGAMRYEGCIGGAEALIRTVQPRIGAGGPRVARDPARPVRRVAPGGMLARAQGALLGQLAGDALGSYVEFQDAAEIARRHPQGLRDLRDGGHWGTIAGQPTDDSEMALALARSIVARGGFEPAAAGRAYVMWEQSHPFDMGGTTSMGIAALRGRGQASLSSQSNGALMRVSPIGIACAGRPALAAAQGRADAALTHPHPVCVAASGCFAAAVAAGIGGAARQTVWAMAHAHAGEDAAGATIRAVLEAAQSAPPAAYQRQMGWVLTALQNAFHHLWTGETLEDALVATVAAGGDTDTNAAICGALLGAVQGRAAVPLRWRRALATCRTLAAPGITHPRPADYWTDDALDLAEALLACGI